MNLLLKFLEKRASIEADYCQKLDVLLQCIPTKDITNYSEIWKILQQHLENNIKNHKNFGINLEKNIVDDTKQELKNQKTQLDSVRWIL